MPLIGITPTYVGNTVGFVQKVRQIRDHPHLRGEYYMGDQHSSHLMRITPTYVGNT